MNNMFVATNCCDHLIPTAGSYIFIPGLSLLLLLGPLPSEGPTEAARLPVTPDPLGSTSPAAAPLRLLIDISGGPCGGTAALLSLERRHVRHPPCHDALAGCSGDHTTEPW